MRPPAEHRPDFGDSSAGALSIGVGEVAWCLRELSGLDRIAVLAPAGVGTMGVAAAWPDGEVPTSISMRMLDDVMRDGIPRETTDALELEALSSLCGAGAPASAIAVRSGSALALGVRERGDPPDPAERRAFAAGARLLAGAAGPQASDLDPSRIWAGRVADLIASGLALAGETSVDGLLERITVAARDVLGARYAALGVLDSGGTELARFVTSGVHPDVAETIGRPPRGRGLLGAVIREGRTIRLDRIDADARSVGFPDHHPPMETFLGVPIAMRDEVFGNLYVTDKLSGSFTLEDERLAQVLASQAAVAIDNARRYESERLRAEELETALEVGRAMLSVLDVDKLLSFIARRARRLASADTVAVGVREGEELVLRYADGVSRGDLEGLRLGVDLAGLEDRLAGLAEGEWEVVPLEVDSGLAGILVAVRREPFDVGALRLLRLLSTQGAIALSNAKTFAQERQRLMTSATVQAVRAQEKAAAEGFRRTVEAQEAERARIARELHDEAGQVLTGLSLHLRAIEEREQDPEVRASLVELRSSVGQVSSGLRELITELRPTGLREHGLEGAIERQAERLRAATGMSVDVAVGRLPDLAHEVEVAAFRVVQEALTNIARHSGASRASVLVQASEGRLRVVVEDDGRGFDPGAPTDRLGLAGIDERIGLLGGRLRIDSSPGAGTALTVDLDVRGRQ